ncbi:MAG: hypothetical protein IJS14_13000 [Lentisphaeria bacterium]|nr:hypothetical protein [Lentisphaeria bacterium]
MSTKKEITWSLMHPTPIDSAYMRRIAAEAARYDMDSFELCGAFAHPSGGLNGQLLFEPYPAAAAQCDREMVLRTRQTLREIVDIADAIGKPVYLWHREIMMPKGMLEDRPAMLDRDGEFDLLGRDFEDFLRYKIDNVFRVEPKLGGVVLTLTEADFSVIHNSDPDRYPPDRVVEKIVRIFAEEHEKRNKRFILRSFGSIAADYEDILRGARAAAEDHFFDIETKITPYDFDPFLPLNPFLKQQPGTRLNAECDVLGEFLGAGYLPAANVDNIAGYVRSGEAAGVARYAIRLDRIGNSIFDSHEINLYAYHRLIRDPGLTTDDIYREWAEKHWRGCEKEMTELARLGLDAVLKTNFVCGHVMFHLLPLQPDWKWIESGGGIGVYRNDVPLRQLRGNWGILSGCNAPGRAAIRAEKAEAVRLAKEGLARIEKLKNVLDPAEFAKAERVWKHLNIAAPAIAAFSESLASYFDDLDRDLPEPEKLKTAVAEAERLLTSMMDDPSETLPEAVSCSAGAALPGEDLDRVYLKGLRYLCRGMAERYRAEQSLRRAMRPGSLDLVLPGSFGDQWRVFRYMHASHSGLVDGVPVRYAGNPVFPNGFIEVELACEPGGMIEIRLLPGCAAECKLTLNGKAGRTAVPADGIVRIPAEAAKTTLRIEKSGSEYPAVTVIRSLRK